MRLVCIRATASAVTLAIASTLFVLTLAPAARAQYSNPYTYNNNAYLKYAIASQKAKALRKKARRSHHSGANKTAKTKPTHSAAKHGNAPIKKAK